MIQDVHKQIIKLANSILGYNDKDNTANLLKAFNVAKINIEQTNSGVYGNSSLATLGDSVASMLLCELFYQELTKGQITDKKGQLLSNSNFDKISDALGLPPLRSDGIFTDDELPLEAKLKNDPSALFEAVLGAMWLDLGEKRTREIWTKLFYPLACKVYSPKNEEVVSEVTTKAEELALKYPNIENEFVALRFEKWSDAKTIIKKGILYFNQRTDKGYEGQGKGLYIGGILQAYKELKAKHDIKSPNKKLEDCVLVYRFDKTNLPKAKNIEAETEYETEIVSIEGSELTYFIKTKDKNIEGNLAIQYKPIAIISISCDKENEIRLFAKEYDLLYIKLI